MIVVDWHTEQRLGGVNAHRAHKFEGVTPVADDRRSVARKLEAAYRHRSIDRPGNSTQLTSVFHGTARRREGT